MKTYNLNVNTAKPISQIVQMQKNATGMLNVTVANDGKYVRNMTCKVYDGATEISPVSESGSTYSFALDIGAETKNLKVVATATPLESTQEYIESYTPGGKRNISLWLNKLVIPAGTYRQDEFEPLKRFGDYSGFMNVLAPASGGDANFDRITIQFGGETRETASMRILFSNSKEGRTLSPDELLVVNEEIKFGSNAYVKTTSRDSIVLGTKTYPAIGYYVDCAVDVVVRPSANAVADGEIEVQNPDVVMDTVTVGGETYPVEWKTITVDGVDYMFLVAKIEEPVDSSDSDLDSTDTDLDSNDSELIDDGNGGE